MSKRRRAVEVDGAPGVVLEAPRGRLAGDVRDGLRVADPLAGAHRLSREVLFGDGVVVDAPPQGRSGVRLGGVLAGDEILGVGARDAADGHHEAAGAVAVAGRLIRAEITLEFAEIGVPRDVTKANGVPEARAGASGEASASALKSEGCDIDHRARALSNAFDTNPNIAPAATHPTPRHDT